MQKLVSSVLGDFVSNNICEEALRTVTVVGNSVRLDGALHRLRGEFQHESEAFVTSEEAKAAVVRDSGETEEIHEKLVRHRFVLSSRVPHIQQSFSQVMNIVQIAERKETHVRIFELVL